VEFRRLAVLSYVRNPQKVHVSRAGKLKKNNPLKNKHLATQGLPNSAAGGGLRQPLYFLYDTDTKLKQLE
jgi:hypothetical protein